MAKGKAAAPWNSLGVTFAGQARMTGDVLRFCAERSLIPSPMASGLVNARFLPAHSYPAQQLGRWHHAIGSFFYKRHGITASRTHLRTEARTIDNSRAGSLRSGIRSKATMDSTVLIRNKTPNYER
jgi:hypothetical protein